MIYPKSDFRPNPERSIQVQGEIGLNLIHQLTPKILALQGQSREPITVYIDSNGGRTDYMFTLLRLLKAKSQDYGRACRLITVVTRLAASAAADLLSTGDYALAYPGSRILFHGVRVSEQAPLTAERMSLLAHVLRLSNEGSARDLASEVEFRFMFRFLSTRGQFAAVRAKITEGHMSDLDCFLDIISENLTEQARGVLKTARQRYNRYDSLVNFVNKKTRSLPASKTPLEIEGAEIKAIVDFEVKNNKKDTDWSFQGIGLNHLTDDFLLLREYQAMEKSDRFKHWCSRFGPLMLKDELVSEIELLPEEDRPDRFLKEVGPPLEPIWSFFVALCHSLQQGENELTATDAYWLGLVDEVLGDEDLPCIRTIFESQPPKQALTDGQQKALTTGEEDGKEETTGDEAAEATGAEAAGAEARPAED